MSFSCKLFPIFFLFLNWFFFPATDSSGQEVTPYPGNFTIKNSSPGLFEFPEFVVESSEHSAHGYYLFDLSPYVVIIDHFGNPLFYKETPGGSRNFEFQPDESYSYYANSAKGFLVMNEYFQITDTFVRVGENLIDFHEFNILENGNYIVLGFDRRVVDMSQYVEGGEIFATVTGMVFQELDPQKNILFQWNSWDHIPFMDSDPDLVDLTAQVIDYIHSNSIVLDSDGNFLLTSRNLSEVTKIDRVTGEIIWRMGGTGNEFDFINDPLGFSAPHSAIRLPNGNIALLDNGCGHEPQFSRGVEYAVDEVEKTANLVREYRASPDVFSPVMGNVTTLSENHLVVGWGNPKTNVLLDEFDDEGEWVASISLSFESFYTAYKVTYLNRFDFFIEPGEDTLNFGEVETGDSVVLAVELSNQGVDPATLFAFTDASGQFEIGAELPVQIPEGATEQISLKFKPIVSGNFFIPAYLHFRLDSTIDDNHMIACRLMLRGTTTAVSSTGKYQTGKGLRIFPNPFHDRVTVANTQDIEVIIIWSITGERMFQMENTGQEQIVLDQNLLNPGFYIFEFRYRDGIQEYVKMVKGG